MKYDEYYHENDAIILNILIKLNNIYNLFMNNEINFLKNLGSFHGCINMYGYLLNCDFLNCCTNNVKIFYGNNSNLNYWIKKKNEKCCTNIFENIPDNQNWCPSLLKLFNKLLPEIKGNNFKCIEKIHNEWYSNKVLTKTEKLLVKWSKKGIKNKKKNNYFDTIQNSKNGLNIYKKNGTYNIIFCHNDNVGLTHYSIESNNNGNIYCLLNDFKSINYFKNCFTKEKNEIINKKNDGSNLLNIIINHTIIMSKMGQTYMILGYLSITEHQVVSLSKILSDLPLSFKKNLFNKIEVNGKIYEKYMVKLQNSSILYRCLNPKKEIMHETKNKFKHIITSYHHNNDNKEHGTEIVVPETPMERLRREIFEMS